MDLIYVKYSNNRKREFQLKTAFYKDNDFIRVEKRNIYEEGKEHILNIEKNYYKMIGQYKNFIINKCLIEDEIINSEYEEGTNFNKLLLNKVNNNDIQGFNNDLMWFKSLIMDFSEENLIDFYYTPEFIEIFGEYGQEFEKFKSLKISNLDFNFSNILINGERVKLIDYEWVFEFPIPIDFIIYRAITNFYFENYSILKNKVKLEEIVELMGIEVFLEKYSQDMFNKFDMYIKGSTFNNPKDIFHKYVKESFDFRQLDVCIKIITNESNQNRWIEDLNIQITNKESYVKELNSQLEAKENYISELNKQVSSSQEYIKVLEQQLNGLREYVEILKEQQLNSLKEYAEILKKQQIDLDNKIVVLRNSLNNKI